MSLKIIKLDNLSSAIDALNETDKNSVNNILANFDTDTDFCQAGNLHELAMNILARIGEEDIINSNMTNYKLEVQSLPSPPEGAGRIISKIVQIVNKL